MADSRNNPSADLPQRVTAVLRHHVHHRQSVVVGLSGGVDSVVMTHVLREVQPQLGFALSAVHVNHRLSPNADAWERFCGELCGRLGIDLSVRRVDVIGIAGAGLEGAARRARYRVYADTRAQWIALAHHRDDQAETVLLNLLRGAGVRGAAGMPVVRALDASQPDGPHLIRPMLTVSRSDIAAYATARGLAWIEDESNAAIRLGRNFLRHEILPRLAARFPAADARLAQAAAHFAEAQGLLDELARQDLDAASCEGRLQVSALRALGTPRARNLLRSMLSRHGIAMPDTVRLDEVLHQLTSARRDAAVEVPLGERVLRRFRGAVFLSSRQADIPVVPRPWRGESELAWGNRRILFEPVQGEGIGLSSLTREPVTIRARRGGERFRPDARRPRRTLKNLLQEAGVPPWQRDGMPLLWCGGQLVWVPGIGVACDYRCPEGEPGVVVTWIDH